MEDLMYQFNWLSPQLAFQHNNNFNPSVIEDDLLKLFEIEAYRSWANLELACQIETEETHNAMDEAEQEINSAMDEAEQEMNSAMDEFQRFAEELEREAMAEYHSLVSTAEAAWKMGKALEKAATIASKKYIEAALNSATTSLRSAWKGVSSRKEP
ncbi:hypothetical protein Cgig2_031997 [Carnegiea gigantea]|uniref:Uncharacterized protein n=1 Tax=Carnegiea gigantea TaxID=171969 RepID=A0A9Q1QCL5_9CARY|nr:hypothetical protein Cgig2_027318 [Carnegiea gigantea]KAJ8436769.1 hypothetical protein Cgig2_031997 [Carnegiea gigantea]